MKSIIGAFVTALFIVCLALPGLVLAGAEGSSATGSLKFQFEEGDTKFVEFKAIREGDGQAAGEMTLSDPDAVPVDDPDGEERPKTPGVLVRAKFDCLKIMENRAVMSGEIFESNVPNAIGLRVLLVIEDNGAEAQKDRLTWGIYPHPLKAWVSKDAERDDDDGAKLTWIATDFERRDDKGIPAGIPTLNQMVQCETFPLSSYDFPEIKAAGGDLKIAR